MSDAGSLVDSLQGIVAREGYEMPQPEQRGEEKQREHTDADEAGEVLEFHPNTEPGHAQKQADDDQRRDQRPPQPLPEMSGPGVGDKTIQPHPRWIARGVCDLGLLDLGARVLIGGVGQSRCSGRSLEGRAGDA